MRLFQLTPTTTINLDHVVRYDTDGPFTVYFSDREKLTLSESHRDEFIKAMKAYSWLGVRSVEERFKELRNERIENTHE